MSRDHAAVGAGMAPIWIIIPRSDYGEPFFRPVPQRVDEVLPAPVSRRCPCGGTVQVERTESQYQEDMPSSCCREFLRPANSLRI